MSIDELVRLNGQAVEEIERTPYQPILYALPEEWLKADRALRQQAADFQPTLSNWKPRKKHRPSS